MLVGVEGGACLLSVPLCHVVINISELLSHCKYVTFPLYPPTSLLEIHCSPSPLLCSPFTPLLLLPVLNFYLDSRWGLHADRLVVNKEQRGARSVPGLSLLQAADHALTSCHLTSDLLVGDVAITQGRHYWACSVEPGSYLVKARTV